MTTTTIIKQNAYDIGKIVSALPLESQHVIFGVAIGMKAGTEIRATHEAVDDSPQARRADRPA